MENLQQIVVKHSWLKKEKQIRTKRKWIFLNTALKGEQIQINTQAKLWNYVIFTIVSNLHSAKDILRGIDIIKTLKFWKWN